MYGNSRLLVHLYTFSICSLSQCPRRHLQWVFIVCSFLSSPLPPLRKNLPWGKFNLLVHRLHPSPLRCGASIEARTAESTTLTTRLSRAFGRSLQHSNLKVRISTRRKLPLFFLFLIHFNTIHSASSYTVVHILFFLQHLFDLFPFHLQCSGELMLQSCPWRENTAPDGRKYYYHTRTQQSVWIKPKVRKLNVYGVCVTQSTWFERQ